MSGLSVSLSASPQSWLGAGLAIDKGMGGEKEVKRRVEERVLRGQCGKSKVNGQVKDNVCR